MQTNNELYKTICENMNIPVEQGVHNNNYYLKQIATVGYGKVYTGTVCNGILIRDIAEAITESTYTGHHFNNFYLKEIASALSPGGDYNNKYDNYLLNIWAENIAPKNPSNLIWQVPPSDMEYGDFNATGLLTGENNTPIEDATVYLVVGSTKVGNAQTNSNGVVTFTGSPVHTGTHSFKLVFDGNTNYTSSESSTVTITVSKESTYLNLTEYTTIGYTDGNIRFAGQLLDNDSPRHFVVGKFIKLMNASTQEVYDTVETDSSGRFVSEFNISTPGTYVIVAFFEGDRDYNPSRQSGDRTIINDPSLDLVADKPILSYADGDEAVLTATLNSADKVGKAVSFDIVDSQGTVLDHLGDGVTGNNGVAVCDTVYTSAGLGDVTVEAEATVSGRLLTKTFVVRDDLFADSMINSIKSAWSNNGFTITSDANGTLLQNTNGLVDKLLYNINQSSFSVEFDYLTGSGSISFGFRVENSNNDYSSYLGYYSTRYRFGANAGSEKSITTSAPSNNHMKLEITPTSHKFYIDDVLIEEVNPSNSTTNQHVGFYLSGSAQQFKVKNFEIKPL